MSISSNIETDVQTVDTPAEDSGAKVAENSQKVEEAGEFEEFTLDDIEVIESKVFA